MIAPGPPRSKARGFFFVGAPWRLRLRTPRLRSLNGSAHDLLRDRRRRCRAASKLLRAPDQPWRQHPSGLSPSQGEARTHMPRQTWIGTLGITSVALFMVSLDNLVVTPALPVIRHNLHASISQLEWTVNAYTLTFAVLLLTGAALGDRFGRRRMFALGLFLFTGASAAAALSTSPNALDLARALQGVGAAIVTPLTLTILSAAVPRERRGLALGIWGGIGGLAIAIGPLVGGAIVNGISWHWIFWLNVPIGLVLAPLA